MFREPEEAKIFDTDPLADDPTDADEVNMDVQKYYGAKDIYGTFSSISTPISVAATNPLSS